GCGPIASTLTGWLAGPLQKVPSQSAVRRASPGSLIAIADGSSMPPASELSSNCWRCCGPGLSSNGWRGRNQPCRSRAPCSAATERECRNRSAGIAPSQAWTWFELQAATPISSSSPTSPRTASGNDKVLGVFMPEHHSSDDSLRLGRSWAAQLGISTVLEDISPALEGLGAYRRQIEAIRTVVPEYDDSWKCKRGLPPF